MKITISHVETLEYHDFPLLFVGHDPIGGLYLCLAVAEVDGQPQYTAVAISMDKLISLKSGRIDLRSTFAQPELGGWFVVSNFDETYAIAVPMVGVSTLPETMLPASGEFLSLKSRINPESFSAVKLGAVAKEAGMNPTLLRQYVSGTKRPSAEQALRVQDALHRVGRRLLEVRLVPNFV